ncbi:unnamed protein product, partial [Lepidochelys kempii]
SRSAQPRPGEPWALGAAPGCAHALDARTGGAEREAPTNPWARHVLQRHHPLLTPRCPGGHGLLLCPASGSRGQRGVVVHPPAPCAPISVSGHRAGSAELRAAAARHLTSAWTRPWGLAEAALALAKANNQALRRLEEEVGGAAEGGAPDRQGQPLPDGGRGARGARGGG